MIALMAMVGQTSAALIDIANETYTHFANFTNEHPFKPVSYISSSISPVYLDVGWHNHPSSDPGFPQFADILLTDRYAVSGLRLQVHVNPFKDFTLQGSNNTTTGIDGTWADIYSNTVTDRTEYAWQEWFFTNSVSYSAYRIYIKNDYVGAWAMYRWDLMAEPNPVTIPPGIWLLGSGLIGLVGLRRKFASYLKT